MPTDPIQLLNPDPGEVPRITSAERFVAGFQVCVLALFFGILGVIFAVGPKFERMFEEMEIEPAAFSAMVLRLSWLRWCLWGAALAVLIGGMAGIWSPRDPQWIRSTKVLRMLAVFGAGLAVAVVAVCVIVGLLKPIYFDMGGLGR